MLNRNIQSDNTIVIEMVRNDTDGMICFYGIKSINAMVDKQKETSPNISINLVTKLVANKKNMKCFGAETIQDLYDVIATYESEE